MTHLSAIENLKILKGYRQALFFFIFFKAKANKNVSVIFFPKTPTDTKKTLHSAAKCISLTLHYCAGDSKAENEIDIKLTRNR